MRVHHIRDLSVAGAAIALSACGGGGESVQSTPFVPAPQGPTGALAKPPAGVTTTTDFTTTNPDVSIRWNAQLNAYEVQIPGYPAGRVTQSSFGPAGASGEVVAADGTTLYSVSARTPYTYTGIMDLGLEPIHYVAYGVPTPAGAVPTVGSATFDAEIDGHAGGWPVYGSAEFNFDFAAGTLAGFMDPHTNGPMESPYLPRYTFTETVFSPGSTTFSGKFDQGGTFSGLFTGPAAQELMARFSAPFVDWDTSENPVVPGVMEGVMIGRRH